MIEKLEKMMKKMEYIYQPIRHDYDENKEIYVYFKDRTWKLQDQKGGEVFLETKKPKDILNFIQEYKFSLEHLHNYCYNNLATKGVHIRRQLEDIYELIGSEEVDKQENAWNAFAKNVAEVIKTEMKKPKLEVVDG